MNALKNLILSLASVLMLAGVVSVVAPSSVFAADPPKECTTRFLTFPAWYDGLLSTDGKCEIVPPDQGEAGSAKQESKSVSVFIFTIILNIVEILLQVVGYAAVGYVIYGGFKYLTSAGSADRITAGRKIIMNSLIGLTISFLSVGIVNLISMNIESSGDTDCTEVNGGRVDADCVGVAKVDGNTAITGVLNTVYTAAGITAIIVIIISAIFYVISQGEPAKVKRGKDGILYALVGLVVILLAFVITNFVIGRF